MRTEDKCVLCYGDVGQAYNSNFEMSENESKSQLLLMDVDSVVRCLCI